MKEKMYSRDSNSLLHDHILDGFAASHEGLRQLRDKALISEQEYTKLLEKNVKRLIERVREFRLAEKLTCVAFAFIFSWIQAAGDDLEMRRSTRSRTQRSAQGRRNGRDDA